MNDNKLKIEIPDEAIMNKILIIRDFKVMIDNDLAAMYGVSTKRLNEQVKRNTKRFPKDFMFQLTEKEKDKVVAICDHLQKSQVLTLLALCIYRTWYSNAASVLNSDQAIMVNIQIVRTFNKMREMMSLNKDVLLEVEMIKNQQNEQGDKILLVLKYLKQFDEAKQNESNHKNRPRIGYKSPKS